MQKSNAFHTTLASNLVLTLPKSLTVFGILLLKNIVVKVSSQTVVFLQWHQKTKPSFMLFNEL